MLKTCLCKKQKKILTDTESEQEDHKPQKKHDEEDQEIETDIESDSGVEGTEDVTPVAEGGVISTVQLMAARRDRLAHEKLRIGALCSSLLEEPEKKVIISSMQVDTTAHTSKNQQQSKYNTNAPALCKNHLN